MLKRIVTAAVAAVLALAASAPAVYGQKALVYCPVGIDATGCDRIVTALQSKFTDGVDRGYDGSSGTVDLTKVDLHHYGVFVVPSLADDATKQPYALLRSVASRLHFAITGRVAVYSGAPDQGSTNRSDKDALIQSLATWAANGHSRATGLVGLVAFLDLSEHAADRYSWVRDISLTDVSADAQLTAFSDVQPVSARGTSVMSAGGRAVRFTNMASYGLHIGRRAAARTEVGALGGTSGAQSVLVMYSNADGKDGATGGSAGTGQVGSTGASMDVSGAKATLSTGSLGGSTMSTGSTSAPAITTDKPDYQPGDTVTFTGTGFAAGDTVTITVHEDPTWSYPDRQFVAVADGNGTFTNRGMVVQQLDLGVTFTATAVAVPSGLVAQTTFTDGSISVVASTTGITITASVVAYSGTGSCSSGGVAKPNILFSSIGTTVGGLNTNDAVKLTFVSATPATTTFLNWDGSGLTHANATVDLPSKSICVVASANNVGGTLVASVSATQTVNITVSSSALTSTYGQSVTFTATASVANATGSVQFRIDGSDFGTPASLTGTTTSTASISTSTLAAGNHPVTAVYTPGSGFAAGSVNSITQTVSPKPVVITPTAGQTKVFGTTDPALTFGNDGGLAPADFTGALARAAGENVGNYAIALGTLSAGANYSLSLSATPVDFAITPKPVVITPNTGQFKIFGAADPTLTFTNDASLVDNAFTGALSRVPGENVGTYAIALGTLSAGANYSLSVATPAVTLEIKPKPVVITPNAGQFKIFGAADPSLTYTNDASLAAGAFTGALSRASGENVGTYAITLGTLSAGGNYALTMVTPAVTFEIKPKTVVITPDANQSKVYGTASDPTLTFTNDGGLAINQFTGSLSRTAGETVGPYAIALGSLSAGTNYSLTLTAAVVNFSITKKDVTVTVAAADKVYDGDNSATITTCTVNGKVGSDDVTCSAASATFASAAAGATAQTVTATGITLGGSTAPNYNLPTATATTQAKINPRPVTVTADAKSKTYGDADPALTYQVTTGSIIEGDSFSGSLTRDAGETVGSYAIKQGTLALSSNYTLSYAGANLVINTRAVTITADAKAKTYGDADPALTYQITLGSLAFSDAFAGSLTREAGENVGTFAIRQGTVTLNNNYVLTYVGASLTINKRPVTITADAKTKVYGEADPALTYQITSGSLVGSDAFSGSLTRATGENVGSYAITQGTVVLSANYALTYVGANLAVTPRPITVTADAQTKVYGDADPSFTYKLTSGTLVNGDAISGSLARAAGENVGTYAITKGALTAGGNYDLSYVPANLTITARPITVTADPQTRVYGDADPSLSYQVTSGNLVGSDKFSGGLSRVAGANVGTYAIQQGTLTAGANYNLTYVGANLTITQRPITVTADAQSKTYGDADPVLTYKVTSGNLVGSDAFSGALSRDAGASVVGGPYQIRQNTLSAGGNYNLTYVGATLTITPRAITVQPVAADLIWTGVPQAPVYSTTIASGSLGNGDPITALGTPIYLPAAVTDVGTYTTSESGLLNANYTISYATGTVNVLDKSAPVGAITSLNPVPLNTNATLTVNLSDVNTGNSKIVSWQYTIDSVTWVPVTPSSQTSNLTQSVTIAGFPATDVKRVCVVGTDAGGNPSTAVCALLAIYDPSAGFVTGGGWINSPVGAYAANPTLVGKANFGFTSKYQKGANVPTGNTEFQFQAGNLNFSSTDFQWLVIQSDNSAQFKGTGTINGSGKYNFLVTAIDGDNYTGAKKPDAFRIKITDFVTGAVVYDNQMGQDDSGSAATLLGGGSIVIHSK